MEQQTIRYRAGIVLIITLALCVSVIFSAAEAPISRPATRPKDEIIKYCPARQIATLANKKIRESSGLACSRLKRGVFWTHNDSGDKARIYAFDLTGRDLGTYTIPGAKARDWEDMASFKLNGKSYLLLGDIGDNSSRRKFCTLYLVEEPRLVTGRKRPFHGIAKLVQTIKYVYRDGPVDCESLAVDPATQKIYLVGKRPRRTVYELPLPEKTKKTTKKILIAKLIAKLDLGYTTAMDISPDGRRAVVLTYGPAVQYVRRAGETWAKAFSRTPAMIIIPARKQGESICFGPDGKTLYLTSEHLPTPLLEVPVKKTK